MTCSRCGGENTHPTFRTCDKCRAFCRRPEQKAKHNIRNRRHYWRTKDERMAKSRELKRQRDEESMRRWTQKWEVLHEYASSLGYVPSSNQMSKELGMPIPTAALFRKLCFRVRRQRSGGGQPRIPYPVPAEAQGSMEECLAKSIVDSGRMTIAWKASEPWASTKS